MIDISILEEVFLNHVLFFSSIPFPTLTHSLSPNLHEWRFLKYLNGEQKTPQNETDWE